MTKIKGKFNWNKSEVYTSFVQGADVLNIYNSLKGAMRNGISYDAETKTLIGSNVFVAAKIDTLLKPFGIRVSNLRDLSRPEVMQMVKDKHYADAPALVLRSQGDSYERNLPIVQKLAEQVEKVNGTLQLPVMVTGFDVKILPSDKKGYGITIIPRDDFSAVYDERLKGEHNGKRFLEVDELGLPLFDSKGKRIWYASNVGLRGLFLSRSLDASSGDVSLAYSVDDGRVVLVSAEGTHENLERKLRK